jgi:hypothetical protein
MRIRPKGGTRGPALEPPASMLASYKLVMAMTRNRLCVAVALFALSCGGSATSPTNPPRHGLQAEPVADVPSRPHHSGRSPYEGPRAPQVRWHSTRPPDMLGSR